MEIFERKWRTNLEGNSRSGGSSNRTFVVVKDQIHESYGDNQRI